MDFIHNNNISNSILIIGNGFDLDLGIKTKYIDFANSEYWPFKERFSFEENTLPYFLNSHKNNVETWFDLEELLAKFARDNSILSKEKINETMSDFEILKKKLKEYLEKQEEVFFEKMKKKTHTQRMKSSHSILQDFLEMQNSKIYTFNYTNTQKIAKNLILDFFRGEEVDSINLAGLTYVIAVTALGDASDEKPKILFRAYCTYYFYYHYL